MTEKDPNWRSMKEMQDLYVKERTSLKGVLTFTLYQILIVCLFYWSTR